MSTTDGASARAFTHWKVVMPAALALGGCTTLGPMPATTGISAIPAGRPGLEASVGVLPGYYLSSSVQEKPKGAAVSNAALLVEPDSVLHVPGLLVGGRYLGSANSGGYPEPMIGYRTYLGGDHFIALTAVGYGAYASGDNKGASFSAVRGGAEAGVDVRLTPEYEWFELHFQAAASLTGLSAKGTYCVDSARRYALDCPDTGQGSFMTAEAGGLYPSGTGTIAIDVGRRLAGAFHGGRIAIMAGGGTMPRVASGAQESARAYGSAGLSLTLGFGETK